MSSSWILFTNCNYKCSLCFERTIPYSKIDIKQLINKAKVIRRLLDDLCEKKMEILGGEITILPINDLLKILSPFNEYNGEVTIFSNFTADVPYFLKIINNFKPKRLKFVFSYHANIFTPEEYLKKFKLLYLYCKQKNIILKMELVNHPAFEESNKIFLEYVKEYIEENNIKVDIERFEDVFNNRKNNIVNNLWCGICKIQGNGFTILNNILATDFGYHFVVSNDFLNEEYNTLLKNIKEKRCNNNNCEYKLMKNENTFDKLKIQKIEFDWKQAKKFWWSMFYKCNNRCPECSQKKTPQYGVDEINIEELLAKANKINEYTEMYNLDYLYIMGGEPTVLDLKDLIKILLKFNLERYKKIRLYSNMTAEPLYYYALARTLSKVGIFELELSFHSTIFNIPNFFEKLQHIYDKTKIVSNTNLNLQFTITEQQINLTDDFCENLEKFNKKNNSRIRVQLCPDLAINEDFSCTRKILLKEFTEKYNKLLTTSFPITIKYINGNKEKTNISILKDSDNINFYNLRCYKADSVWLYDKDLRSHCSQNIISYDFLNDKLEDMKIPYSHICKSKKCSLVDNIREIVIP